jgi:hypothetical protein
VTDIEVVGMVYRSPAFLRFLQQQEVCDRIVANDPLPGLNVETCDVYHDPKPDDHYLARVYRCWNYCIATSKSEYVCLVNSDMAFAPG